MSVEVTFPETKATEPSKGTAGLPSRVGGMPTTVSALMEASKAIGNEKMVKKDIK